MLINTYFTCDFALLNLIDVLNKFITNRSETASSENDGEIEYLRWIILIAVIVMTAVMAIIAAWLWWRRKYRRELEKSVVVIQKNPKDSNEGKQNHVVEMEKPIDPGAGANVSPQTIISQMSTSEMGTDLIIEGLQAYIQNIKSQTKMKVR